MKAIVLRLDAPLMSFGTVMVDQHGYIDRFPGTALLVGLIGNALGWHHKDVDRLQKLQDRLEHAARWDVSPQVLTDYHTVDLGQPKMRDDGWTTRGNPEHRDGGNAKTGTHQRYRRYWVDGLMTVVVSLKDDTDPNLDSVASALRRPARPLFLGRKTCLPARPLLDPDSPTLEGTDLRTILDAVEVWDRHGAPSPRHPMEACWPSTVDRFDGRGEVRRVYDLRDWGNQVSAGSQWRVQGLVGEGPS